VLNIGLLLYLFYLQTFMHSLVVFQVSFARRFYLCWLCLHCFCVNHVCLVFTFISIFFWCWCRNINVTYSVIELVNLYRDRVWLSFSDWKPNSRNATWLAALQLIHWSCSQCFHWFYLHLCFFCSVIDVSSPEVAKKTIEVMHRSDIRGRQIIVREARN